MSDEEPATVPEGQSPSGDELTRRRFLGAGAAAGFGVLLGAGPAEAARHPKRRRRKRKRRAKGRLTAANADFVVVGAGFAGLTAAREIARLGRSVIVLEARDRVGGRVQNHVLPNGEVSERGGTFIGPTQDHLAALAGELGIGTFDTYDTGNNVYVNGSNRQTYSDTGPTGTAPLDPVILPDLTNVVSSLDQMSTTVPVDAPWQASSAGTWDAETLDSWIQANSVTPQFRALVPAATRPIFGCEPREISLLYTLFYIASSGNETNPGTFERNFNTRNGGQMSRFIGGSQKIAIDAAGQLGNRVVLSSPVRRIDQDSSGVTVTSDRLSVRARRAIVAIPPTLAGRIIYSPILPPERDQLTQRVPQGSLVKVAAVYDKPFWRDLGLNGTALSTNGLVSATFDDSPRGGSPGVIFGFVGGDQSRIYNRLGAAERRARVLGEFRGFFGDQALGAVDFFDTNWTQEEWSRGCPVALFSPGALSAYGPSLRAPVDRVHWAGTETSTYWAGYMDGAVRSGQRAAKEVTDAS